MLHHAVQESTIKALTVWWCCTSRCKPGGAGVVGSAKLCLNACVDITVADVMYVLLCLFCVDAAAFEPGGSVANCFNDLWVLDLTTGAWTKPEVVGPSPTPRAGHGGVLVGDSWYILGGGNNVKGRCQGYMGSPLQGLLQPETYRSRSRVLSCTPDSKWILLSWLDRQRAGWALASRHCSLLMSINGGVHTRDCH